MVIVSYEDVSAMLSQIGERLDLVEIAGFEDSQSWMLAPDEETGDALSLDYEAQIGKLFITTSLGPTQDEKRLATFEFMLAYNLAWADTDGVRIGLDSDTGDIVLIHDITLHDLDADTLASVLENFMALKRVMGGIVAEGIGEQAGGDVPTPGSHSGMGHLRV